MKETAVQEVASISIVAVVSLCVSTLERRESPMGKVVMYGSVSVDGFIADENDQPGPLFDWLIGGDVPLDESGEVKVSQTSYDYTRPYWEQIAVTIAGRHVFDMTDGWDGSLRAYRPRGRRDTPAGARGLGPRGAVSLRRRRRGSRGQGAGACG